MASHPTMDAGDREVKHSRLKLPTYHFAATAAIYYTAAEPEGFQPGWIGRSEPAARRCPVAPYFTMGAMIRAKWLRARLSRLFTVPRLQPVISAISS